jgi:hypothetical protein
MPKQLLAMPKQFGTIHNKLLAMPKQLLAMPKQLSTIIFEERTIV